MDGTINCKVQRVLEDYDVRCMRFTLNKTFIQGFSSYEGPPEGGERTNQKEWEPQLEAEIGMSRCVEEGGWTWRDVRS